MVCKLHLNKAVKKRIKYQHPFLQESPLMPHMAQAKPCPPPELQNQGAHLGAKLGLKDLCMGPSCPVISKPNLMQRVDSLEKTDAGRDWGQEEKGTTEDEMAGWHHGLDGRESE